MKINPIYLSDSDINLMCVDAYHKITLKCCNIINSDKTLKIYKKEKNKKLFKALVTVSGFNSDTVNAYKLFVIEYKKQCYIHFYTILNKEHAAIFYIKNKNKKFPNKDAADYIHNMKELSDVFENTIDNLEIHKLKKKHALTHVIEYKKPKKQKKNSVKNDTDSKDDAVLSTEKEQFFNQISKLLTISDKKLILFLLGYFLFVKYTHCVKDRYKFTINLISKNIEKAKQLYGFLYLVLSKTNKYPYIIYSNNKTKTSTKNGKQKSAFYDSLKKSKDLTLLVTPSDFNKADRNNLADILAKYYKHYSDKHYADFIIVSNKEFSCEFIKNLAFDTFNENIAVDLKKDTIISRSISDFHKHMKLELKTKYSFFEPFINLDKTEEDINSLSAFAGIELQRYIPVIYFLNKYFTFLKDNEYITPDQYELLSDECKSLYVPSESKDKEDNNVNDLNVNDISNIILQDLLTAYDGNKFSVSDKLSDNPIVYTGCTKSK